MYSPRRLQHSEPSSAATSGSDTSVFISIRRSSCSSASSISVRVRINLPISLDHLPISPDSPVWPSSASIDSNGPESPLSPFSDTSDHDSDTDDDHGRADESESSNDDSNESLSTDDEDELGSAAPPTTPPASSSSPSPITPLRIPAPSYTPPADQWHQANAPPAFPIPHSYPTFRQSRALPPLPPLRIPPVPPRPLRGQLPYSLLYPSGHPAISPRIPATQPPPLFSRSLPFAHPYRPSPGEGSSPTSSTGEGGDVPPPAYSPPRISSPTTSTSPTSDFASSPAFSRTSSLSSAVDISPGIADIPASPSHSPAPGGSSPPNPTSSPATPGTPATPWSGIYTPSADFAISTTPGTSLPSDASSPTPSPTSPSSSRLDPYQHIPGELRESAVYNFPPPPRPPKVPLVPVGHHVEPPAELSASPAPYTGSASSSFATPLSFSTPPASPASTFNHNGAVELAATRPSPLSSPGSIPELDAVNTARGKVEYYDPTSAEVSPADNAKQRRRRRVRKWIAKAGGRLRRMGSRRSMPSSPISID